jgi:hypothetical protein
LETKREVVKCVLSSSHFEGVRVSAQNILDYLDNMETHSLPTTLALQDAKIELVHFLLSLLSLFPSLSPLFTLTLSPTSPFIFFLVSSFQLVSTALGALAIKQEEDNKEIVKLNQVQSDQRTLIEALDKKLIQLSNKGN